MTLVCDLHAQQRNGESTGQLRLLFLILARSARGSTELGTVHSAEARTWSTRASGREWPEKTYWTGLRTAALAASLSIRGIYTPSVRTKLQTNCTCRSAVCYSSTLFNNKHTWLRRVIESIEAFGWFLLEEILVEWILQLLHFKFNFNLPFLLMIAMKLL